MNVFLWILQLLLAAHTAMGAVWKFSHSEQTVPPLQSIPHSVWLALIALELCCSVALVLPAANRQLGLLVPIAALGIAAEMLFFCAVYLHAHATERGQLWYWLVVAAVCAFIAGARLLWRPL